MLATILVCSLKILKLLPQILNIRFQTRRLLCQPFVDFGGWAEDEPVSIHQHLLLVFMTCDLNQVEKQPEVTSRYHSCDCRDDKK